MHRFRNSLDVRDVVDFASKQESWTDEKILRALGQWGWAPEGSEVINTSDYEVVFMPESFGGGASVPRIASDRSAAELVDEVHGLARERDVDEVRWSVYPTTTPNDLSDHLLRIGGTISDEGALMSLLIPEDGVLDVGPIDGIVVHPVSDAKSFTHYRQTQAPVYEQPVATHEQISAEAATIDVNDPQGCRFVGYLDGQPVGTGTIMVRDDGSASLFGAATTPEFRGRGVYRALLAARVRWAREHDVPIVLVSGRINTSFPIMQRVGFTVHGYTQGIVAPALKR